MRLAVCALSAVLLSGCSWLGTGGQSNGYGATNGAYGANCGQGQGAAYGQAASYGQAGYYGQGGDAGCAGGAYGVAQGQGYGQGFGAGQGYGAGYGTGAGYGAGAGGFGAGGAAGYGQAGYGQAGYGAGAYGAGAQGYGAGLNGATSYASSGYGPGAVGAGLAAQGIGGGYGGQGAYGGAGYGTSGVTTLGAAAPYGASAYGGNVVGTQLNNGQYVNGQYVQNVVGAPIYVPQPYAAPYGVPQLRGVGAALPFGFELFGGTEFDIDGDVKSGKGTSPSDGGGGQAGEFGDVSYSDAFSDGYSIGAATTYDISRNTTLVGSLAYSEKDGRRVDAGSFQPGTYDAAGAFVPAVGSTERDLTGEFSDLEQYTIEGGVRQYVGNGYGLRPYVGASAGFAYNNDVDLTQTYNDDGTLFGEQEFIDSGWRPTAAGIVGAELPVGHRGAIGIESGIRWRDNLKGAADDRISIPVRLRGRLAF